MSDVYYLPVAGTYGSSVKVDTYSLIAQFGQEMLAKGLIYGGYQILSGSQLLTSSMSVQDFQISSQQDAVIHSLDNQSCLGTQQIDIFAQTVWNGSADVPSSSWGLVRTQEYLKDGIALGRIGIFNIQNPNIYFKTYFTNMSVAPAYSGFIKFVQ